MVIYGYIIFNRKQILHSSFDTDYNKKLAIFIEFYSGGSCCAFDERLFYIIRDVFNTCNLIAIMTNIEYNSINLINDFNSFKFNEFHKNKINKVIFN